MVVLRTQIPAPEKDRPNMPVLASMVADRHPEDIKAMIRKRGITLEALSEQLGYSRVAVGITLRRPWPSVQAGIAAFLNLDPVAIWPSRYEADGRPRRGRLRRADRKPSRQAEARLRQKHQAA